MSRQSTARLAGVLNLLMGIPATYTLIYIPRTFIVPGDAAATAERIVSSAALYRTAAFADLISGVFGIWLAVVLYELFRHVNRTHARLLVGFIFGMVATEVVLAVLTSAPLLFATDTEYLRAFNSSQREALTLAFWNLRSQAVRLASVYWGVWLLPLGTLVYQSRFLPRWLGVVVFIAGCTYVLTALAYVFTPGYARLVATISMVPQGLGEAGFIAWVLIKGVRAETSVAGSESPT